MYVYKKIIVDVGASGQRNVHLLILVLIMCHNTVYTFRVFMYYTQFINMCILFINTLGVSLTHHSAIALPIPLPWLVVGVNSYLVNSSHSITRAILVCRRC